MYAQICRQHLIYVYSLVFYVIQLSKFLLLRLYCFVVKILKIKMTSNSKDVLNRNIANISLRELRMTSAMSSLAANRTKTILAPSSSSTNTRFKKVWIPTYFKSGIKILLHKTVIMNFLKIRFFIEWHTYSTFLLRWLFIFGLSNQGI